MHIFPQSVQTQNTLEIKQFKNVDKKQYIKKEGKNEPTLVVNRGNGNSNYKLTYAARLIFKILLVRSILYFMIDDQYIWFFMDKTHTRRTIVHDLNTYGDSVALFLVALVAVYSLTTIFAP